MGVNRFERRTPNGRILLGLTAAALIGWFVFTLGIVMPMAVQGFADQDPYISLTVRNTVLLMGLFGIPIALLLSLLVGFPLWKLAERRGFHLPKHGLLWGAMAGAIISLVLTGYTVLSGLPTYFDPNAGYDYADGTGLIVRDGLLTVRGWLLEGRRLLVMSAVGALAGFFAVTVGRRGTVPVALD